MRKPLIQRLAVAFAAILIGWSLAAQPQVTLSGQVIDDFGDPLMGVGVIQQGTTNGVATDLDGMYSITVPEGATVEFSYIGFKPQTFVAEKTMTLNVQLLPDTEMLEETVVVGYGVQKKSNVTGAISQVKSEDIQNRTIVSPESALQGKTAGVQVFSSSARPGASPSVQVRGISSNGSSNPLYVVDGRRTNSIAGIDPNDIESMEVLKDGASAAIYGAEAGNGVIMITTRRGQGEGKISYSFQLTSQSLNHIPKVMNSEQYMQYFIENGRYNIQDFYGNWDFQTNTDWLAYSYENSLMQHHNLSFSAGAEKGNLYISATYLDNNGMFAGDADVYKRLTSMVNASWNFKPWLDIQTNNQVEYYQARSVSEGSDYGSAVLAALQLDPLTPPTYAPDQLPDFMQDYLNSGRTLLKDENGNYYGVSFFNPSENVNPHVMRDRSYSTSNGFNINGSTAINFKPIRNLTITSRLGYRLSSGDNYGYSLRYYINQNAYQNYIGLSGSDNNSVYYQWENFANWFQDFGNHNISLMLGTSFSSNRSFSMSGSYRGSDDDLGVMQDNPLFYYFAYHSANAVPSVSGAEPSFSRKLSYFGRAGWSYLGKYNLQATFRADAADLSILPRPMRWGYFPSVSAGWTISEEDFFTNIRQAVNYAKFRASWGQNGSLAGLYGYRYANVIASTGKYPTGNGLEYIIGYAPSSSGNDELKWETSEQLDFGLDLRFLRDRLTFSVDWFNKMTKDLIVTGITPSTVVGVSASPVNAGNVRNTGMEFELKWRDQIGDFHYSIGGNLSTLKNEVTYIHETLSDGIDGVGVRNYGTITRFEKGYPAWHFYGYHFTGIDPRTGDAMFEDIDGSGDVTQADKIDLGSGIPKVNFGVTLTAAWKGIDAVVFLTGAAGSKIYNCLTVVDYPSNRLSFLTEDRWTPDHTNGTMPAANASNWQQFLTSDGVVFDGTYAKIKQIQLGFTFPQNLTRKFAVDNLRLYGSLDDWFTFSKYPGFDPEITGTGSGLGVDKGSYPTAKKVVFGINITF
ncbi:MAG: TonB-dependent receptor [Bacteroidales bacterium]|jgi:TonB-linked outer membrane protein, SusC/RagA family|nr:TonB-dependent receptor [Bacteroidales bacterium]